MLFALDIDGTIAWPDHKAKIEPLTFTSEDDRRAKYREFLREDRPILAAQEGVRRIASCGHQIVFVTNRFESCRDVTDEWLRKHFPVVAVPEILMRADDETKTDKGEMKDGHYAALADRARASNQTMVTFDNRDECLVAASRYGMALRAPMCWDRLRIVSNGTVWFAP